MRLDKFLADCGIGTRSEIKKLIRAGKVSVSGMDKIKPETQIEPETAKVYFEGRLLEYKEFIYLMLNKPAGYVSATWDRHLPTVLDLVPEEYLHFEPFPVGRLDIDTEGFCLLTNDGAFAHRILSPAHHVPKTYVAQLDIAATEDDIEAFAKGITLDDGYTTKPAKLSILPDFMAEVVIEEGKYHQVKRMFAARGKHVEHLMRIQINNLPLDEDLEEGEIRELTREEVELLENE